MLPSAAMQRLTLTVCVLMAFTAAAQKEELFGSGKPVVFREESIDRRFAKTKLAKLLENPPADAMANAGCMQLLGGLLVALAELAPTLHKRDENFYLDPMLVDAVNNQLSTPRFTAMSYLVAMVRRVMIEKRLPDEWLETAKKVNAKVKIIDLARLKQLNDGLQLADSAYFQIPVLKSRYALEVGAANSAVTTDVARSFHDAYVDRSVAWGAVTLLDAGLNTPKGKKATAAQLTELVAILEYTPPDMRKQVLDLTGRSPVAAPQPIRVIAQLSPKQFYDLEKAFKGQRMMVKGTFWEMNRTLTEVQITNAVLFDDRDWSNGVRLADPAAVDQCPAALNDLMGLSPNQPGGFKH